MMILDKPVSRQFLVDMQENYFGDMVKAVVDTDRHLLAVDAELHADLEMILLEDGSEQSSLWGINLYPEMGGEDFIEFDSMINIRPYQGNPSRDVLDCSIREKISEIVSDLIK